MRRVPLWVSLVIILVMLPVFSLPQLLASCPAADDGRRTLLWLYPGYVVVAAWLAWICWPTRSYMTWILLVLMILSHVAAWMLVTMP